MTIEMTPVESSMIDALGFDEESLTLAVTFRATHSTWHYRPVPASTYTALLHSPSIGKTFNSLIKGHYSAAQVS